MANKKTKTLNWTASEYIDHNRGASWYLALAAITTVFAAGFYIWTKDYFGTVTIVILGIIVGVVARWKPNDIKYELSSQGLNVGDKLYPYSSFKSFSVLHEGDLSSLMLMPTKRFMPPITVFFDEQDEDNLVSIIEDHLPLEERSVDRVDRLSRRLRL
ncbi:MAG TPA: hypothetical protein VMT23_03480 [Candidatus Binatia bacterium]|nr:hypothetical protein [Candidatus Binatia bacterium]